MNNPNKRPNYNLRRGVALLGVIAAASGVHELTKGSPPNKGPQRVEAYTVHNGDNAWGLSEAAYDKGDVRMETDRLSASLPDDLEHSASHLQPGDIILFPPDANLPGAKEIFVKPDLAKDLPKYVAEEPQDLSDNLQISNP